MLAGREGGMLWRGVRAVGLANGAGRWRPHGVNTAQFDRRLPQRAAPQLPRSSRLHLCVSVCICVHLWFQS